MLNLTRDSNNSDDDDDADDDDDDDDDVDDVDDNDGDSDGAGAGYYNCRHRRSFNSGCGMRSRGEETFEEGR